MLSRDAYDCQRDSKVDTGCCFDGAMAQRVPLALYLPFSRRGDMPDGANIVDGTGLSSVSGHAATANYLVISR